GVDAGVRARPCRPDARLQLRLLGRVSLGGLSRAQIAGARLRARGLLRRGDQAFALGALASQLAGAAHRFRLLAGALLGGLFIVDVALHLAERAFALHLLLERFQRLVDVVVANENLDDDTSSSGAAPSRRARQIAERPRFVHTGARQARV